MNRRILASTLINTRMQRNVSQIRLAKEAGISRYRLSLFEQGLHDLTHDEFKAIRKALRKFEPLPTLDVGNSPDVLDLGHIPEIKVPCILRKAI